LLPRQSSDANDGAAMMTASIAAAIVEIALFMNPKKKCPPGEIPRRALARLSRYAIESSCKAYQSGTQMLHLHVQRPPI